MTVDPHPASLIDQGAAIDAMTASYVSGGYWDAHAASQRPELAQADLEGRWRLIDDLGEDDPSIAAMAARQTYDAPLSDELAKVVHDWMVRRAAFAHRVLSEIPLVGGTVSATRAVACRPDDLRPALGVHWSWDPSWCGGADAFWAPGGDEDLPVLHLHVPIPVSSVDWPMTMLCAMDYLCGDDERELRLTPGAPIPTPTIEIDGVEAAIPPHLVDAAGVPTAFTA